MHQFDKEWSDAVYNFVVDARRHLDSQTKQKLDLIETHHKGWLTVADAITKGLGSIADAIKQHGRRS